MIKKKAAPKSRRSAGGFTGKYPPTPFAFFRTTFHNNNILIGNDPAQIRFLSQVLRHEVTHVDQVTDEMLLGNEGLLLQVSAEHRIDISSDVKRNTGIWNADPILKGSAGANAIVRCAARLIGMPDKPSREVLDFVATEITRAGVLDIRGAVSRAAWLLTGDILPKVKQIEPWEHPIRWMRPEHDPEYRLHALYNILVAWALLATGEAGGAGHLDVSLVREDYLKTLKLDKQRVYQSIKQLSIWKLKGGNPYCCALHIASIWS
jgi:hypothetical protein